MEGQAQRLHLMDQSQSSRHLQVACSEHSTSDHRGGGWVGGNHINMFQLLYWVVAEDSWQNSKKSLNRMYETWGLPSIVVHGMDAWSSGLFTIGICLLGVVLTPFNSFPLWRRFPFQPRCLVNTTCRAPLVLGRKEGINACASCTHR